MADSKTASNSTTVEQRGDRELFIARTFDATPAQVFKAWTDPDAIKQWWGPRTWPTVYCTIDLRVGGVWHYCMRSTENGQESWGKATYDEIAAPDRLAYTDAFSDKDGNTFPPVSRTSMRFIADGNKTRVESIAAWDSPADLKTVLEMGMIEGMTETQDRLVEYLATQTS